MPRYVFQGGDGDEPIRNKEATLPSNFHAKAMTVTLCRHWSQDVRVWRFNRGQIRNPPLFHVQWDGDEPQIPPREE